MTGSTEPVRDQLRDGRRDALFTRTLAKHLELVVHCQLVEELGGPSGPFQPRRHKDLLNRKDVAVGR